MAQWISGGGQLPQMSPTSAAVLIRDDQGIGHMDRPQDVAVPYEPEDDTMVSNTIL